MDVLIWPRIPLGPEITDYDTVLWFTELSLGAALAVVSHLCAKYAYITQSCNVLIIYSFHQKVSLTNPVS